MRRRKIWEEILRRLSEAAERLEEILRKLEETKKTKEEEMENLVSKQKEALAFLQQEIEELKELKEKEKATKEGFIVLVDFANVQLELESKELVFPGKRLLGELTTFLGKPLIGAFAFFEFFSPQVRTLEDAGFFSVFTVDADLAILKSLSLFSAVDTFVLITGDKRLAHRASLEILHFYPQKKLLWLFPYENSFKDEAGSLVIKLYSRPEPEESFVGREEEEAKLLLFRLENKRLFNPQNIPSDRVLLLVLHLLLEEAREELSSIRQHGFRDLADTIYVRLFTNPHISTDPHLSPYLNKKWLSAVLSALVDKEVLIRRQNPETKRVYYVLNQKHPLWENARMFFKEIIAAYFEKE